MDTRKTLKKRAKSDPLIRQALQEKCKKLRGQDLLRASRQRSEKCSSVVENDYNVLAQMKVAKPTAVKVVAKPTEVNKSIDEQQYQRDAPGHTSCLRINRKFFNQCS